MTVGKIFGGSIMLLGAVVIGAEMLFIHDWDTLALGIANVAGGMAIILLDNRLIQTRKSAKLARASADAAQQQLDEAQQRLQDTIDRVVREDDAERKTQVTTDSLKPVREMVEKLSKEFGVPLRMTPPLFDTDTFEKRHLFYFERDGESKELNSRLNCDLWQDRVESLKDPREPVDVDLLGALESALRTELQARLTGTT